MRNYRLGDVFPREGKSRLGYVLKTSGLCVQHEYSSVPPPQESIWPQKSGDINKIPGLKNTYHIPWSYNKEIFVIVNLKRDN